MWCDGCSLPSLTASAHVTRSHCSTSLSLQAGHPSHAPEVVEAKGEQLEVLTLSQHASSALPCFPEWSSCTHTHTHLHTHTLAHTLHCCLTFWLPLHSPLLGRIFCICCLHFLTPAPFLGYSSLLFAPVITLGAALAKGGNCLPTLLPLLSDIFGSFSSVTSQWWQCMMYSPLGLPRCCPALCLFFSPYFPLHVFSICLKVPCFLYSDANWEFPLWFLAGISHPNRFHS